VADEEGREVVTTRLQIGLYGETRLLSEIDDPELASLTSYGELERLEVHILSIECGELGYTQTR
jgi:hypothetical protein